MIGPLVEMRGARSRGAEVRRLPSFLIIGAQKSGTSWLHHHLRSHPEIYMPAHEVHYFDKRENFSRGLLWYSRFFEDAADASAVGEKTPEYLWANGSGAEGHLPNVHENIHGQLPSAKLVAILRDPVERAISAVHHIMRSGRVSARHHVDDLLLGDQAHLVADHKVVEKGLYARQLGEYFRLFPRTQIKILFFEDSVAANQRETLHDVCCFLGVDPTFPFRRVEAKRNANRSSTLGARVGAHLSRKRPAGVRLGSKVVRRIDSLLPGRLRRPSDQVIRRLYEFYREPNRELAGLLGLGSVPWQP